MEKNRHSFKRALMMEESEKKTLMHETLYNGNHIIPGFTVGNGSMFKTQVAAIIGNDFYFRVYAIGMSGQSTGVYTAWSKRSKVLYSDIC